VEGAAQNFWRDTQSRYKLLRGDKGRPLLPPTELFLEVDVFFAALKPYPRIEIAASAAETTQPCATQALPPIQVDRRAEIRWKNSGISWMNSADACCCWRKGWGGAKPCCSTWLNTG